MKHRNSHSGWTENRGLATLACPPRTGPCIMRVNPALTVPPKLNHYALEEIGVGTGPWSLGITCLRRGPL